MAERQPQPDTVSVQRRNDLPRIMASGMPSGSSNNPLDVPTPFFIAWEMHGKFPQILTDKLIGTEATKLYNDANVLLDILVKEKC